MKQGQIISMFTFMEGDKFFEKQSSLIWEVDKVRNTNTVEDPKFIVGFKIEGDNIDEDLLERQTEDGLFWFSVDDLRTYIGTELLLIDKGCENGRHDVKVVIQTIDEAEWEIGSLCDFIQEEHKNFELDKMEERYRETGSYLTEEEQEAYDKAHKKPTADDIVEQMDREEEYRNMSEEELYVELEEAFEDLPTLADEAKELGYKFYISFTNLENESINCFNALTRYPELKEIEGLIEPGDNKGELLYRGELSKEELVLKLINMDFGFLDPSRFN
jgi:hypothetical protein